jgi:hypothetical protein
MIEKQLKHSFIRGEKLFIHIYSSIKCFGKSAVYAFI